MPLKYTLRADGPTDAMLMPILRWILVRALPEVELQGSFADPRVFPPGTARRLVPSIRSAVDLYPCDLLFVHRDAEGEDPNSRVREIAAAMEDVSRVASVRSISVIPVRMSEAWLLIDEAALRRAAGNPNGKSPLSLPSMKNLENLPDPKAELHSLLRAACELRGRRLKSFRPEDRIPLLSDLILDYSPLRKLTAFQRLTNAISEFCADYRSGTSSR